jgi:hypothetical protein
MALAPNWQHMYDYISYDHYHLVRKVQQGLGCSYSSWLDKHSVLLIYMINFGALWEPLL